MSRGEDRAVLIDRHIREVAFNRHLGIDFHDCGEGWIELAMVWRQEFGGADGFGNALGPLTTLFDSASGACVLMAGRLDMAAATLSLSVEYFGDVAVGECVIVRAERRHQRDGIEYVHAVARTATQAQVGMATAVFATARRAVSGSSDASEVTAFLDRPTADDLGGGRR